MLTASALFGPALKTLHAFRRNERGATATIFAVAAIPICMAVTLGIIVTDVFAARDQLNAAADAAALSAVGHAYLGSNAATARTAALQVFGIQSTVNGVTLISNDVVVTDTITTRTAVATYAATVNVPFLALFNSGAVTITGTSTGVTTLPTYIDFYLLLDNTPSMSIGATTSDIAAMNAATATPTTSYMRSNGQCAFACHDLSAAPNDYYTLAKSLTPKFNMRIDVVRSATQSLMDTAAAAETVSGQYRAGVYTFGTDATALGLTTIAALNSNLTTVKTAASAIDVMTIPNQGYNNDQITDFDGTLSAMNRVMTTPGDGSAPSSPQKVLFFVSDGVADFAYPSTCSQSLLSSTRCQEPITVADCTAIKSRGIRIAVLYTTYYPLTNNDWYNTTVAPWSSQIATNMRSCASTGLFFEVSPSGGIAAAMNALFQKAVSTARLSQ
jgi:Flp pilus assembly protein TadG